MNNFNSELLDFIKNCTTSYTTIKYLKELLIKNGYQELTENTSWKLTQKKYFVIRNDASLIAFNLNNKTPKNFKIVCTHCDTPSFAIKPNPTFFENGYLKLNVVPYGGLLNYGFMDRPLSIAGRIITKNNNTLTKTIIDLHKPMAVIPSIAIHQNNKANTNLDLNTEIDLMPIISLNKNISLEKIITKELNLKDKIIDYDLFLYPNAKPEIINNEFILSPRIDNLTCTYAATKSFLNNFDDSLNVLTVFNSEEIGSNTYEGADSNFLIDTLKRICALKKLDISLTLANSFIISADNTHARHPSHDELSDHTNTPKLNAGVLIVKEINGTTTGPTGAIIKKICEDLKIPYKYYTSRNDFATGSTQAGLNLKHLSINSVDLALPMLAMHSSMELIGLKDTYRLFKTFKYFYKIKYSLKNNKIIFK